MWISSSRSVLRPFGMGPFALPIAGVQPNLVEIQPAANPRDDGGGDHHRSVPVRGLMHAKEVPWETVWEPLAAFSSPQLGRENANLGTLWNYIRDFKMVAARNERRPPSNPRP